MPSDALERKLTAIMYADVVGFSRLAGENEEGTYRVLRERLGRISELVSAQGGRVVKFIGDAPSSCRRANAPRRSRRKLPRTWKLMSSCCTD